MARIEARRALAAIDECAAELIRASCRAADTDPSLCVGLRLLSAHVLSKGDAFRETYDPGKDVDPAVAFLSLQSGRA